MVGVQLANRIIGEAERYRAEEVSRSVVRGLSGLELVELENWMVRFSLVRHRLLL